jgi:Sap, sulfolipid-1-addressing protein
MVSVLGELLPLMVALALSTVPIMVTVTLLLAPSSGPSALAFLIGWLLGLFVIAGGLCLIVQALPRTALSRDTPVVGFLEIVLGLGLIGSGIFLAVRARSGSPQTELPRWVRTAGTMRPSAAFWLAVALNLRPKALVLLTAAALNLGTTRLTGAEVVIVLLLFVAVSGSSVAVPIVLALADRDAMQRPLRAIEQWIVRRGRIVTIIAAFLIGAVLIWHGTTRL